MVYKVKDSVRIIKNYNYFSSIVCVYTYQFSLVLFCYFLGSKFSVVSKTGSCG